jgi:hypothetical protein
LTDDGVNDLVFVRCKATLHWQAVALRELFVDLLTEARLMQE